MVQLSSQPGTVSDSAQKTTEVVSAQTSPDWDILEEEWLSDEPELESDAHRDQIDLLLGLMRWYWRERDDVYCSGNTTVYYDPQQRTNRNFRGPDLYVVFGAQKRPRNSWMIWKERGKYPDIVIELLSDSTANVDRTTKKELYQNTWHLPNYFWFHPQTLEFKGFRLVGLQYQEIQPNPEGYLWSDVLNLYLGLHENQLWLFTAEGERVLSKDEDAMRIAEAERQRADAAAQRAERLAEKLRQLGVDPDE